MRRAYASITDAMVDRGRIITRNDEMGFRAIADLATHGQREMMLSKLVEQTAMRDGLIATHDALEQQLEEAQVDVQQLAGPAAELDHLVREHQVALAVFASALAKADTSKADQFAAYPLAQIVEVPIANPKPVSPSKKIAVLAAGAGTFFILFGLTLIWMRRTILRLLSRAFTHPMAEGATAAPAPVAAPEPAPASSPKASREPPDLDNKSLDDEPLIEIPHQQEYGISYSYDVRPRRKDRQK